MISLLVPQSVRDARQARVREKRAELRVKWDGLGQEGLSGSEPPEEAQKRREDAQKAACIRLRDGHDRRAQNLHSLYVQAQLLGGFMILLGTFYVVVTQLTNLTWIGAAVILLGLGVIPAIWIVLPTLNVLFPKYKIGDAGMRAMTEGDFDWYFETDQRIATIQRDMLRIRWGLAIAGVSTILSVLIALVAGFAHWISTL